MAGNTSFPPALSPFNLANQHYPPSPPILHPVCFQDLCRNVTIHRHRVIIESTSIAAMSSLLFTFFVIVTENRLWYSNKALKLFLEHMEQPVYSFLSSGVVLVLGFPYNNELYFVWAILLMVGFQSLICVTGYSLLNVGAMKLTYIQLLAYNDVNGFLIGSLPKASKFQYPLWTLWAVTTLKLLQRFISLLSAEYRYSMEKTKLISDYMKDEHEKNVGINPITMEGYKYIVFGDDQVKTDEIKPPLYRMSLDIENPLIVTADELWASDDRLLSKELDPKNRLKDLCLSFGLCKLLRRRFLNYPAAEADQPKTRKFVFKGLLSGDKERPFRVIKTELGFYKDLLYTKHPIVFSHGLPVYNFTLTFLMVSVACWLSKVAYHDFNREQLNDEDEVLNTTKSGRNIDLYVTYILVAMIIAMEVMEFCTYVFSDWARVMFIRKHLNSPWLKRVPFLDKAFALVSRRSLLQPLGNRLGQYSLLRNYKSSTKRMLYNITCNIYGKKPGDGLRQDPYQSVSPEVKEAVFDSLQVNQDVRLYNGSSSLNRNGVSQLSWACPFDQDDILTIMIWHVATSYCEIIPPDETKGLVNRETKANKIVATSLSKYCAYLVVFLPDLLPGSGNAGRFVFNKIVHETRDFFKGTGRNTKQKYYKMKLLHSDHKSELTVIAKGALLGKQLAEELQSQEKIWKVLADFWAELIVYLAPSNNVITHLSQLREGGEFITHLWVLLYHAGIIERPEPLPFGESP